MKKFTFDALATVRHINPRKEGPEDDKNLALDIKLNGIVTDAIWDYFHEQIRNVLYTDAGAVKNIMMDSIAFSHSVKNCTLKMLGHTFHGAEIKNFKVRPKDGHLAELTFSATIEPSGTDIAMIAEYLQEEVPVVIEPQPDLFDGGQNP